MYDIAIIGLGPAGATLARMLRRGLSVIAIDKKSLTASHGFRKPCGGLLAMDAQKALSKFRLALPKEVLVDPQIFAVKTIDTKQNLLRYYQRFYMNLDRHKFDQWLMRMIPGHVELVTESHCKSIIRTADGFVITYRQNERETCVGARYIVGADGANSLVRKTLFAHRIIPRFLSIQQFFPERHANPFYSCVFDSEITDSYCWSLSKDGFFILGGAFPIRDAKQRFELLKKKIEQHGYALGEPVRTEACLVSSPKGIRHFCAAGGNAFLVGEAAGFISPSSLEGISYALNSAYTLANVLNGQSQNPCRAYRVKTLPIRMKLLMKYSKAPFMYQPFLRKLVMSSGLQSVDVVPDVPN